VRENGSEEGEKWRRERKFKETRRDGSHTSNEYGEKKRTLRREGRESTPREQHRATSAATGSTSDGMERAAPTDERMGWTVEWRGG
jgi:hypothetical protein